MTFAMFHGSLYFRRKEWKNKKEIEKEKRKKNNLCIDPHNTGRMCKKLEDCILKWKYVGYSTTNFTVLLFYQWTVLPNGNHALVLVTIYFN